MADLDPALEASASRLTRVRSAASLPPVRRRNLWISVGLAVQLVGVAIPVTAVVVRAKHEAVSGVALKATLLMVARELFRSPGGIALLAASVVLFALGSVLLARPFVRSLGTLIVAVPLAAVAGVAVLGALAFVVVVIALLAWAGFDGSGIGSSGRKKKPGQAAAGDPGR